MAFVSTDEIRTPALVVRSQSFIHGATPQLACGEGTKGKNVTLPHLFSTALKSLLFEKELQNLFKIGCLLFYVL